MEFRFIGFDQKQNTRIYRFDGIAKGEPTVQFEISADLALFLKHHVGLQEGPSLCAHKLAADLANLQQPEHELPNADHELTDGDLLAYALSREARKGKSPGIGLRRRMERREALSGAQELPDLPSHPGI